MDEVPDARDISDSTLEEMVQLTEPAWELGEADSTERGFSSVYRVTQAGTGPSRELSVKASPDGRNWGSPTEARLEAVIKAQTSIPVPEVLGVADDHESLPTPFYRMSSLPGEDIASEHIGHLENDVLGRLAEETGRYLAELHSLPAVDSFGHVRHDGPTLRGGRPAGALSTLTVGDPYEDWPTYLRKRVGHDLDRHADSRFSSLTPEFEKWFDAGIEDLDGPFDPVMGRNDHGLHNLFIDPESGEITAMLDWAYTLAVPPAFDFQFGVYLFSGAFLAGLPGISDGRSVVREAMLSGYSARSPDRAEAISTPEPLYEALVMVRIMNDFDRLDLPDGTEVSAMDRIRSDIQALLREGLGLSVSDRQANRVL